MADCQQQSLQINTNSYATCCQTKQFPTVVFNQEKLVFNVYSKYTNVVIVVKLCCVESLMEDRCTSNKHSR